MPRDTCKAPATLPLFSSSGESRTSTTSVLALEIISRALAGVILGTAVLAASIICLRLVAMLSSFRDRAAAARNSLIRAADAEFNRFFQRCLHRGVWEQGKRVSRNGAVVTSALNRVLQRPMLDHQ